MGDNDTLGKRIGYPDTSQDAGSQSSIWDKIKQALGLG